ncbi:type IV secretion system protein VirB2 [Neorickettsia risticii str. Illinois]|uniref:Type IV secretion system protein VirB2 n=1 Tax=Neorickettsia risticii (strain Illinois) TaxID=434131 RepID=C6V5P6_NEORI|nr:TrbC/VirB2 family protein [Neorickettsia risticii]ACT69708.1 type IV secretion system protein VirB2 [Neorickettsia risticii str. Illinois]
MSKIAMFCLMLCCILLFVEPAEARKSSSGSSDVVSSVICNIVTQLSGPISQAIATLVIIITGYSFFVGKVSIGMLFIVAAGIMFVFGAQTIMGWILGQRAYECKGGSIVQGAQAK